VHAPRITAKPAKAKPSKMTVLDCSGTGETNGLGEPKEALI